MRTDAAVLVACARSARADADGERLREALLHIKRWEGLTLAASFHRMQGLLYARTSGLVESPVPDVVRETWRSAALETGVTALSLTRQLLLLTARLADAGVPTVHLKGPVLSQQLWDTPALRLSTDLDMLVRPEKVETARTVLHRSGLHDVFDFGRHKRDARRLLAAEQEIAFHHPRTGLHLDLHWRIGPRFAPDSLLAEELFARAEEITLLGRTVRALGPADVVLVHVVHAATHEWKKIEDLAVMVAALERLQPGDSAALLRLAGNHDCRRRLHVGVLLAATLCGAAVPARLLAAARGDKRAKDLAAEVGALLLCANVRERAAACGRARGVIWQARALDTTAATAKHLSRRLLTAGSRDWAIEDARRAGEPAAPAPVLDALRVQFHRQRRLWGRPSD